MLSSLILTAFLMGLSGAPHCATMCGVPCAAALRRSLPLSALLGRWLGYSVLGFMAAASAGLVSQWSREISFLKPLWLMAQGAAVSMFRNIKRRFVLCNIGNREIPGGIARAGTVFSIRCLRVYLRLISRFFRR